MSLDHIRMLRALAEAAAFEGNENREEATSRLAISQSRIYSRAADSLEAQDRALMGEDKRGGPPTPRAKSAGRPRR